MEFCSLSGARTFLDTNLVHLEVFNATHITRLLMGAQPTGVAPALLPDILHESIHHWCFNTPVGIALSLSRTELMERSLTDSSGTGLGNLLARQRLTFELIRPIVEGLACFAEFDAFPGAGNLSCHPFQWLRPIARPAEHFRLGSVPTSDPSGPLLEDILTEMRSAESTARRKDALLAQPLDPRRRGGYLTGYLLVKGFQSTRYL